jgi:DNA-binding response OmpR family regulator
MKARPQRSRRGREAGTLCESREALRVSERAVLIVEDDREIVGLMRDFLELEGFAVLAVDNGDEALAAITAGSIACVLLDIMLPAESGFEICRRIRQWHDVPVLFLSARDGDSDKLRGLGLGADDYVVKSATPAEVVARVKAVLRRSTSARPSDDQRQLLRFGRLELDLQAQEARVEGKPVRLTAKEFAILRLFAEHPRQVFSRDHLFELVWGSYGDRSAVGVYMRKLRGKIEADPANPVLLVTVWGMGYRFEGQRE